MAIFRRFGQVLSAAVAILGRGGFFLSENPDIASVAHKPHKPPNAFLIDGPTE